MNTCSNNKTILYCILIFMIVVNLPLTGQKESVQSFVKDKWEPGYSSLYQSLKGTGPLPMKRRTVFFHEKKSNFILGTKEYGWFCKAEWALEKKIAFPVKFRLGSYQAASKLEGK